MHRPRNLVIPSLASYLALLVASCIIFSKLFLLNDSAYADAASDKKYQELVSTYLHAAFYKDPMSLHKFDAGRSITFGRFCYVSNRATCDLTNKYIKRGIEVNADLELAYQSENPQIEAVFFEPVTTDPSHLSDRESKIAGGFSDVSDPDCKVFSNFDGPIIAHSMVEVSLEQPEDKIVRCISVQIVQAFGLSVAETKSFAEIWSGPSVGVKNLSEQEFQTFIRNALILVTIQMCPKLKAGMNKTEVQEQLRPTSMCLADLLKESK